MGLKQNKLKVGKLSVSHEFHSGLSLRNAKLDPLKWLSSFQMHWNEMPEGQKDE